MIGKQFEISSEREMISLGLQMSIRILEGTTVFLRGELAAGKTTFVRGWMRGRDYDGAVKSPTFTIVESYEMTIPPVHHFDLYRLAGELELELIGIDEYFVPGTDVLIEWPEKCRAVLPKPDLEIEYQFADEGRLVEIRTENPKLYSVVEEIDLIT